MSAMHIILIGAGAVVGIGILGMTAFVIRTIGATRKRIPVDTTGRLEVVARDVPFGKDGSDLALDVLGPEAGEGKRPLVLLVPGDGPQWFIGKAKEWVFFRSYAEICASRGYIAAVMNHRSSENYKNTAALAEDVVDALGTLRDRADELGIDADRIIVWTFSGSSGPVLSRLLSQPEKGVRGLVSFYGFLDLTTYPMKVPEPVVRDYSLPQVLARLDDVTCPVYLLGAGKDRKIVTRGFERTGEVISGRGWPFITRLVPEARHGFEISSPPAQVEAEIDRAFTFVGDCLAS